MSYRGIAADVEALEDAIEALPTQCLYHGDKVTAAEIGDVSGWARNTYDGACCATGRSALYRRRAEAALERLRENL